MLAPFSPPHLNAAPFCSHRWFVWMRAPRSLQWRIVIWFSQPVKWVPCLWVEPSEAIQWYNTLRCYCVGSGAILSAAIFMCAGLILVCDTCMWKLFIVCNFCGCYSACLWLFMIGCGVPLVCLSLCVCKSSEFAVSAFDPLLQHSELAAEVCSLIYYWLTTT